MDGHFVPNITLGPPVVASLRRSTDLFLDCHLMITDPAKYLPAFAEAGANSCSVHVELGHTKALIAQARDLGIGIGLVANPDTSFEELAPFLADIDLVLLMTVFPGFGGQSFIESVLPKIEQTADEINRLNVQTIIQVDGGITAATSAHCAVAGARAFVAGNAIFSQDDPLAAAAAIRHSVDTALDGRAA